jgi:hypothetical protein
MLERALNRHRHDDRRKIVVDSSSEVTTKLHPEDPCFDGFRLDVQGFEVESGVPHQPFGDDETKLGARNRCRNAAKAYRAVNSGVLPHLTVGMEGGLEWRETPPAAAALPSKAAVSSKASAKYLKSAASKDGNGFSHVENGVKSSSHPGSPAKELYCMAWMAIYGRRYVFEPRVPTSRRADSIRNERLHI